MNFDEAFHALRFWRPAKYCGNVLKSLPTSHTELYGVSRAPKLFSPTAKGQSGIAQSVLFGCSKILTLFNRGCPANVSGFVSFSWVNAVYGGAIRRVAHILVKSRKIVFPFIADRNTSTAPQIKSVGVRVVATVFHRDPSVIRPALTFSMSKTGFTKLLSMETAARSCNSRSQFVTPYQRSSSTVTKAFPSYDWSFVSVQPIFTSFLHNQASKT
jgi:type IV secretory pathway TrbD component